MRQMFSRLRTCIDREKRAFASALKGREGPQSHICRRQRLFLTREPVLSTSTGRNKHCGGSRLAQVQLGPSSCQGNDCTLGLMRAGTLFSMESSRSRASVCVCFNKVHGLCLNRYRWVPSIIYCREFIVLK